MVQSSALPFLTQLLGQSLHDSFSMPVSYRGLIAAYPIFPTPACLYARDSMLRRASLEDWELARGHCPLQCLKSFTPGEVGHISHSQLWCSDPCSAQEGEVDWLAPELHLKGLALFEIECQELHG